MIYLDEAIRYRHSVRTFLDKAVGQSKVKEILEAARHAPSAKNRQPWKFVVLSQPQKDNIADIMTFSGIENNAKGNTVAESAEIVRKAPVLIAVFSVEKPSPSTFISFGACLENMSLKAVDLGLGSVIICDSQCADNQIADCLGKTAHLIALFAAGYEKGAVKFKEKKPLAALVEGIEGYEQPDVVINELPEANIDTEPFLFISYCHRDSAVVLSDICELKKHGVRFWYDKSIYAGEVWDDKALNVIRRKNCAGVVVYISENSVKSQPVAKELLCAKERFDGEQGHIISVHIGDKPISVYLEDNDALKKEFNGVIAENSKYIARKSMPSSLEAIDEIVDNALRLGVVSESGIYDEFRYKNVPEGMEITRYVGSSKIVAVPDHIAGKRVVSIGSSAFRDNLCVEEVQVPYSVRTIGEGAFFGMNNLREVNLPDTLEYLGVAAFRKCHSLMYVRLPHSLKRLEEALFRECISLIKCDVPSGVTEFGEAVFNGCTSLVRVKAKNVVKMTEGGFFNCRNLETVELSPDVVGLEEGSFATCPKVDARYCGFHYHDGTADIK